MPFLPTGYLTWVSIHLDRCPPRLSYVSAPRLSSNAPPDTNLCPHTGVTSVHFRPHSSKKHRYGKIDLLLDSSTSLCSLLRLFYTQCFRDPASHLLLAVNHSTLCPSIEADQAQPCLNTNRQGFLLSDLGPEIWLFETREIASDRWMPSIWLFEHLLLHRGTNTAISEATPPSMPAHIVVHNKRSRTLLCRTRAFWPPFSPQL